jgi:ribosomal protein S18 acetylase RimI-like enzyme
MTALRIVDVADLATFQALPPCADPSFDHRTCDYWENADRGSRAARPAWLEAPVPTPSPKPVLADNPFAREEAGPAFNPFLADGDGDDDDPENPFAPRVQRERPAASGVPRKFALLDRGRGIFGTYAKMGLLDGTAVAYAQFGPLSAYPRAQRVRDLYSQLPASPLPAVITCIATTPMARGAGHARALVSAVCDDLAARGFAAVEAYPEAGVRADGTSAATPGFWLGCGFVTAVDDERFPVMRREL